MIGRKLKNYQIEELLGEGGMGVVYRAKDLNLDRVVALKMLHPEMLHQPDLLKRFKNEAHVTARLTHPNIATLYNFFSEGDLHCLVMEYVRGKTLEEILQYHNQIPPQECIRILIQLMEGLEEAHANGILHRDIKPGNVMINQSGYVKLMDFGVARFEHSARITRMNRVIGTLEYMAPELLTGGKPNIQADLYSVGVVAYEIYTGKLPFEADNDGVLTELILKGKFSYPDQSSGFEYRRNKKLERIINRLMQKKTSKRYISSKEVLADLISCNVSGRVSKTLLSKEPISMRTTGKQTNAYPDYLEAAKEIVLKISNKSTDTVKSIKSLVRQKNPAVLEFLKTSEGKIIGGAVAFAILIIIFANIFSGLGPENGLPQVSGSELSEESAMNYSGMNRNLGSNPSVSSQHERESTEPESGWEAPPPPVIPSQNTNTRSTRTRNVDRKDSPPELPGSKSSASENKADDKDDNKDVNSEERSIENRRDSIEPENTQSGTNPSELIEDSEDKKDEPATRKITISVNNGIVEGIFNESVSTTSHKEGDTFYLVVAADVYSNGYKVINAGAKIRGRVQQVRDRGSSRRATLAVTFENVEAVDGSWLPISYPEYSDRATGSVTFEKGRRISRLRIESGVVTLELE